jgi:hypothetical protein
MQEILRNYPQSWSTVDLADLSLSISNSVSETDEHQLKEICNLLRWASARLSSYPVPLLSLLPQIKNQFYTKLNESSIKGVGAFVCLFHQLMKGGQINSWKKDGVLEVAILQKIIEHYTTVSYQERKIINDSDVYIFAEIISGLAAFSAISKDMPEWNTFWNAMCSALQTLSSRLNPRYFSEIISR